MSGGMTPAEPGSEFFEAVRGILAEARHKAATSINFIMVEAYWRIGRQIVEEEEGGAARAEYGQALILELSRRLGDEFGRGFSVANLKNFRQFYLTFPEMGKGYALRSELGWTHQDIGQMDMYVRMFDDLKRGADDNPTLGVILCADKDETVVRYSVLKDNEQLFASKYLSVLPTEEELARELDARRVLDVCGEEREAS